MSIDVRCVFFVDINFIFNVPKCLIFRTFQDLFINPSKKVNFSDKVGVGGSSPLIPTTSKCLTTVKHFFFIQKKSVESLLSLASFLEKKNGLQRKFASENECKNHSLSSPQPFYRALRDIR